MSLFLSKGFDTIETLQPPPPKKKKLSYSWKTPFLLKWWSRKQTNRYCVVQRIFVTKQKKINLVFFYYDSDENEDKKIDLQDTIFFKRTKKWLHAFFFFKCFAVLVFLLTKAFSMGETKITTRKNWNFAIFYSLNAGWDWWRILFLLKN